MDKSADAQLTKALRRALPAAFLQGVFYGMGFVTAVAVLVPILLMMLRSVDWPPIVASFIEDVVEQMERR